MLRTHCGTWIYKHCACISAVDIERSTLCFTFDLPVKEVAAWLPTGDKLVIEQPQPLAIAVLLTVAAYEGGRFTLDMHC
jgi:hypothetical protein